MSGTNEKKIKASWDTVTTKIFCEICVEEVNAGNRPHTHFNRAGWANVGMKFKERAKRSYEYKQLKNKWDSLKRDWLLWKQLKGTETGLGWDHVRGTIDASSTWWDERLKACPEAAKFREGGLENIELMEIMFSKTVATGETAWTPSSGVMPHEIDNDVQDTIAVELDEDLEEDMDMSNKFSDVKMNSPIMDTQDRKQKRKAVNSQMMEQMNAKKGGNNKAKVGTAMYMQKQMDRICDAIENFNSTTIESMTQKKNDSIGSSILECLDLLENSLKIEPTSELYMIGTRLFIKKEYREMFIALRRVDVQLAWLKQELERERRDITRY